MKKHPKEWPLDRTIPDIKFSKPEDITSDLIRRGYILNIPNKPKKLTKAMKSQLLEYLHDIEQKGDYWGNQKQFWERHEKIKEWVKAQE